MGNSFYGGRDARPFDIKKTFTSVDAMNTAFSDGLNYTEVNYGDYVFIQCNNRNDITHGNIYRRGFNGAEYVGNISGPTGSAPHLDFSKSFDSINTAILTAGTANITLVPGKEVDDNKVEKYCDEISYRWESIRDDNNTDTTVYMGLKAPYTIFDFTATSIDAYSPPSANRDIDAIGDHKFYEKWNLGIPKGTKGDTLYNITTTGDSETNNLAYRFIVRNYDKGNEDYNIDKISEQYYDFPYNIIDKVEFSDTGSLTIKQTAAEDYESGNKVNWIKEASLDEKGLLEITFNNDNISKISKNLTWIKEASLDENTGLLNISFNNNIKNPDIKTYLKWVTTATLTEDGEFQFQLNTDKQPKTLNIPIIESAKINEKGELVLGLKGNGSITTTGTTLRQIKSIEHNTDTNKLIFNYTDEKISSDEIDFFPQNFYISDDIPEKAPNDSVWAITESWFGND